MRLKTERHQGAAERTIKDIGRATGCPLLADFDEKVGNLFLTVIL